MDLHQGHREKMRQRFLVTGLEGFADHEALELLLYYAIPRQDTNAIAHDLMERYGSLSAVLSASAAELQTVPGIGVNASVLLPLVSLLARRARTADAEKNAILDSTARAGAFFRERFAGQTLERLYLACLDRKGKLLSCRQMSEGGASCAELDLRKLVEQALRSNASAAILAHNHPRGVALPSGEDLDATRRAREALDVIGVELVDHLVFADNDFVSLAESGYLNNA